ncbi:hypothetical protein pphageB21_01 [Pseudomonas phage pphageB21]|nr:hypothetical protein pphageB21_01 [Pseudomonas phage pphageB21]
MCCVSLVIPLVIPHEYSYLLPICYLSVHHQCISLFLLCSMLLSFLRYLRLPARSLRSWQGPQSLVSSEMSSCFTPPLLSTICHF